MSKARMFTVRLEAEIADAMDALQERDGVPYAEQFRRALRPWLIEKGVLEEQKKAERKRAATRKRP